MTLTVDVRRPARAAGARARDDRARSGRAPIPPIELGRDDSVHPRPEPSFLYSNRSYWYPQPRSPTTRPPRIRITVPGSYGCVASGDAGVPTRRAVDAAGTRPGAEGVHVHGDAAAPLPGVPRQPLRARRPLDGRVRPGRSAADGGADDGAPTLDAAPLRQARPDRRGQPAPDAGGREDWPSAPATSCSSIESLVGDSPYPSFTLALVESDAARRPQPGYFAALNQPLPNTPRHVAQRPGRVRQLPRVLPRARDRASVVGTGRRLANYHEQWLSEGFAQYFAALYAQQVPRRRGVRRRAAADAPLGDRRVRPGAGVPRLPRRPHQERQPRLPGDRLQQGRARAAHAAAARRRRGVLRRASGASTPSRDSARSAPTTSGWRWSRSRAAPSTRSSSAGSTARRCPS